MSDKFAIGQSPLRLEDARLITGRGCYVADITPPGCLNLVFARSAYASSRITAIDAGPARAMPGVEQVITGADIAGMPDFPVNPLLDNVTVPHAPALVSDHVNAAGDPIAAVIAETSSAALDAAELIDADYAPRTTPPGTDTATPFSHHWRSGDVEAAFAAAAHVAKATITHPRLAPSPLEPRGCLASFDADANHLTVWLPVQTPHRARQDLARMLSLDEDQVRVIAPDVGGTFGMKAALGREELITAFAAMRLPRPVKWIATRSEDFLSATHGRGAVARGELALAGDGTFLALKADVTCPVGHWLPFSAAVPAMNAGRILPGPYAIENVQINARGAQEPRAPVGIYRGAGRPEAAMLMEQLADEAARLTGMDAIALRCKNFVCARAMPRTGPTGIVLDSGDYAAALETLLATAGYEKLCTARDQRRRAGAVTGLGLAFYVEPSGTGWESARIRLNEDGTLTAASGSSAQGQGRATAYTQVLASTLGVNPEHITVTFGDTATAPPGIGALASRSTAIGASALVAASRKLKARIAAGEPLPLEVATRYHTEAESWGYGCTLAAVTIDRDTGVLSVDTLYAVDDAGTIVNPQLFEGQLHGGMAQGIGEACMEQVIYDQDGQLLTGSFMDYALPRAAHMPAIHLHTLTTPAPGNLLGAKGIGEAGTIGTPAAIFNAARDALSPFGVTHLDMPLTSERLWRAMTGRPSPAQPQE